MAKAKHRPALTDDEIKYTASLLKKSYIDNLTKPPYHPDFPNDNACGYDKVHEDYCLQLMQKFGALAAKITHGVANPAYTSKDKTSKQQVLEDLGGSFEVPTAYESIGARRLAHYTKFNLTPEDCTFKEIADAMEYRFQNGLMSNAEADAYEAKQWEAAL
jgi:hypothetical protein